MDPFFFRRTLDAIRDIDYVETRAMSHSMRERTTRHDDTEAADIADSRHVARVNLEQAVRADIQQLREALDSQQHHSTFFNTLKRALN